MIIAIDGPAGSGKSSTARRLAERLGWVYLDTGAMYRAAALALLRAGRPITEDAAAELLPETTIDVHVGRSGTRVLLDGQDVTDALRRPEVSEASSHASALRPVRERLIAEQRRVARQIGALGLVVEGRDIGTVVFPEADLKVFLTASIEERARRRHRELRTSAEHLSLPEVRQEILRRDERDRQRALSPLKPAHDAITVDTSGLSLDEQVERIIDLLKARQREHATR